MQANGRTTQQNAGQETKICSLCSLEKQQSKKKKSATVHQYYGGKSSGAEEPEWYSSSGVPVSVEGHVHVSREMRVTVSVHCVTMRKKTTKTPTHTITPETGRKDNC